MANDFASASGRWYTRDGNPCYTIIGKNGKERNTTLRDARQLALVPSVTTIINCAAKPALENWKIDQALMAALTLPRLPGELLDDFMKRAKQDSKEQAIKAAARGIALHGAIERYIRDGIPDTQWALHIANIRNALASIGITLLDGKAERSFSSLLGYGGKLDWHDDLAVVDFKGKPTINDKVTAYDEHGMQLSAYAEGLSLVNARRINVFIGIDDEQVKIHEWPIETHAKHWRMFQSLLTYWQTMNGHMEVAA